MKLVKVFKKFILKLNDDDDIIRKFMQFDAMHLIDACNDACGPVLLPGLIFGI